jgi:hypothetical protein
MAAYDSEHSGTVVDPSHYQAGQNTRRSWPEDDHPLHERFAIECNYGHVFEVTKMQLIRLTGSAASHVIYLRGARRADPSIARLSRGRRRSGGFASGH